MSTLIDTARLLIKSHVLRVKKCGDRLIQMLDSIENLTVSKFNVELIVLIRKSEVIVTLPMKQK